MLFIGYYHHSSKEIEQARYEGANIKMKYNYRFLGKRSSIENFEGYSKLSSTALQIFERMTATDTIEVYRLSDLCKDQEKDSDKRRRIGIREYVYEALMELCRARLVLRAFVNDDEYFIVNYSLLNRLIGKGVR